MFRAEADGVCVSTSKGRDEWEGQKKAASVRERDARRAVGLVEVITGVNIHVELQKILESEARFRGLQEPILQAIIKH